MFVFGLPYITNRISIDSEQDAVVVRLPSICPPEALRPYYQDGDLAGTDKITMEYASKDELDFNRRLIAKFQIRRGASFWPRGFSPVRLLLPDKHSSHFSVVLRLCQMDCWRESRSGDRSYAGAATSLLHPPRS